MTVRVRARIACAVPALLCGASAMAGAQELRGNIVLADGITPAGGAIVVVLPVSGDSVIARAVTGARGAYAVRAPAGASVRVEVRRVGFRPMGLGTYTLAAGETRVVDVSLASMPIVLAEVDTRASSRCETRPGRGADSAGVVAQLYEEARKALIVSATAVAGSRSTASYTLFTRRETLRGRPVSPTSRTAVSGPSTRPFASLSADSLERVGYVSQEGDGTVYRAPDADVLLSDRFASSHCFTYVEGEKAYAPYRGIGFRPVRERREIVDVRGTLWFDRATSELEFIEYQYEGIPREHQKGGVGGRVEFARTGAGGWLVSRWSIRMPRVTSRYQEGTARVSRGAIQGGGGGVIETFVDTIIVTGGEVLSVNVDGETLYSSAPTISADEITGGSAPRTAIPGSLPAARGATTAGFDTLRVESTCEAMRDPAFRGVVTGRVRGTDGGGRSGVPVTAEWRQDFRHAGGHEWRWEYRELTALTGPDGSYILCGAPLDRVVNVWAGDSLATSVTARRARGVVVRMTAREAKGTANLTIGVPAAVASGRSSLLRVVDAGGRAIPHAVVHVNEGVSRVADGEGRVIVPVVSRDSIRLSVRRLGFQPFQGQVGRAGTGEPFVVTLLPAAQALARVDVRANAARTSLELTGFYDRAATVQRGAMLGDFLTPEEIDLRPSAKLSGLLSGSRYVKVAMIAEDWGDTPRPVLVGRANCVMTVFVDGVRQTDLAQGKDPLSARNPAARKGAGPRSIAIDDLVSAGSITAVEVYPTAFGAPAQFQAPSTASPNCGVVVIWTGGR